MDRRTRYVPTFSPHRKVHPITARSALQFSAEAGVPTGIEKVEGNDPKTPFCLPASEDTLGYFQRQATGPPYWSVPASEPRHIPPASHMHCLSNVVQLELKKKGWP